MSFTSTSSLYNDKENFDLRTLPIRKSRVQVPQTPIKPSIDVELGLLRLQVPESSSDLWKKLNTNLKYISAESLALDCNLDMIDPNSDLLVNDINLFKQKQKLFSLKHSLLLQNCIDLAAKLQPPTLNDPVDSDLSFESVR